METAETYSVAYCAPGGRAAAEALLAERGEQVARIAEHPWLEGTDGIYIVAEDPLDLTKILPPFEIEIRNPFQVRWVLDEMYGMLVNRPGAGFILPLT
jgi:hypothetical protein